MSRFWDMGSHPSLLRPTIDTTTKHVILSKHSEPKDLYLSLPAHLLALLF